MTTMKVGFALVISMLATPSFADFRYSGSPKFGWSYVPASSQVRVVPESVLDANASIQLAPRAMVKGGIERRAP